MLHRCPQMGPSPRDRWLPLRKKATRAWGGNDMQLTFDTSVEGAAGGAAGGVDVAVVAAACWGSDNVSTRFS